jgi:HD-like signal output (HDOD) protein
MAGWLSRLFSSQPAPAKEPRRAVVNATPEPAEATSEDSAIPAEHRHPSEFQRVSWMQRDGLNANFMKWLFDGSDESDLFANQLEKEILASLEKIVHSNQAGSDLVRRMPGVVPQLLQSLRNDDFSGAELAKKISNDVVLVAAVIRIANSSLYKSSEAITSIEHAVLVLGQAGLRQLITSVAFKPIIDLKSGHFTKSIAPKIWEQSEQCAVANRVLAEGTSIVPFDAFLVGLIQNVGLIVSLRIIDQLSDQNQRIGSSSFYSSLVNYARKLSVSISREWNFPPSVIDALEEQGSTSRQAQMSPLGRILESGDYVSKLKILSDNQCMPADDPYFFKGLAENAITCLREIKELDHPPATPDPE